ncbi:MAG: heparan-alpha-glucosaminide N-acetyltransferase [Candidatus Thermoplasmatota archaeon]|nr:heparan-alpha-glucosaminide N-acetyltransferase [Candidatus Thermoplasmatota archaeon]
MKNKPIERFWEIDLLRGIAIIMMIIYHIIFDLNYFKIYKTAIYSAPMLIFLYPIGAMFLLLVGISLTLSYSRAQKNLTKKQLQLKFLKRGLWVFCLGLIITLVTWFYLKEGFIIFGVLHCIGVSIILAYPLIKYRFENLVIGVILILLGVLLRTMRFEFSYLLWLGFIPSSFYTLDYFPLLPWFGVVLLGVFLGNTFYKDNERKFKLNDISQNIVIRFMCFLGRHSLVIYLLHQLIIIAVIHLIFL